jgi:putative flippase GtrA
MSQKNLFYDFIKYNFIAIIATLTDFLSFALLTKILGIWYVYAAVLSAVLGGLLAFVFNKTWVFKQAQGKLTKQAVRYITVWLSSILLNTFGLYILVENTDISELYAKILVSILVGVFFNFLMNKYYVFNTTQ